MKKKKQRNPKKKYKYINIQHSVGSEATTLPDCDILSNGYFVVSSVTYQSNILKVFVVDTSANVITANFEITGM